MSDFVEVTLEDGTRVLFQTAESDLVRAHGAAPEIEKFTDATGRLEAIAHATGQACAAFTKNLKPDELTMEIGIGLSGEVGWFFAKSKMDASLKVKLTWKPGSDS